MDPCIVKVCRLDFTFSWRGYLCLLPIIFMHFSWSLNVLSCAKFLFILMKKTNEYWSSSRNVQLVVLVGSAMSHLLRLRMLRWFWFHVIVAIIFAYCSQVKLYYILYCSVWFWCILDSLFLLICMMQNALSKEHFLGNRMLEVKVATPKVQCSYTSWQKFLCYFSSPSNAVLVLSRLTINVLHWLELIKMGQLAWFSIDFFIWLDMKIAFYQVKAHVYSHVPLNVF